MNDPLMRISESTWPVFELQNKIYSLQASKNENFMNYKFQLFIIACQLIEYLFNECISRKRNRIFFLSFI